jgi:aspartyl-tRNA(Asn)/glutamyl-tRNA(Gln) amidotransferase subunit B
MSLGSAGESGSKITGDVEQYLVDGYLPTIGIECHVQLNTATKLFSAVDNDAREAEPNSKVSVIDYALPGMLPYLNHEAVVKAARAGKALNSEIAHESRFDRKHYFYPDLPKGYQITQMYQPIIIGGCVELPSRMDSATGAQNDKNNVQNDKPVRVRIHHAHLEEDAGKLTHYGDHSLVDLNRAGTPLIEIVAEPDIHSAAEAREYCEELHGLMTFAGVTFGDLYYGNMRFDVNVSVAKTTDKELGIRAEIKNLNSFRAVEKATEFEISRQIKILESGEKVQQETRGWVDDAGKTVSQRSKEDAQDYRYMPDADIPPVILTDAEIAQMQENMPILPPEYRKEFAKLNVDDSVVRVLLSDQKIAAKILEVLEKSDAETAKRVANWFASSFKVEEEK